MPTVERNLAYYRSISEYVPQVGDYIVWSGFFSTWHGLVTGIDGKIAVIWAGVPSLLFTMDIDEQKQETRYITISKLRDAYKGTFAILQHDSKQNANIWFI